MKTSKFFLSTLIAAAAMSANAYAEDYTVTDNSQDLINATTDDTVTINFSSNSNSYLYSDINSSSYVINANVEIVDATIHNGFSDKTYIFNGDVTGTGPFYYQADKGSNNQTYVFNGDVSGYSGSMSVANVKTGTFTFTNKTGTGAITATNANSVLNLNGATVNNSAINVSTINISGGTTFAAASGTTLTGNVVVASGATMAVNSALTLSETITNSGAITFAEGASLAFNGEGTTVVNGLNVTTNGLQELDSTITYTLASGLGSISGLTTSNLTLNGVAASTISADCKTATIEGESVSVYNVATSTSVDISTVTTAIGNTSVDYVNVAGTLTGLGTTMSSNDIRGSGLVQVDDGIMEYHNQTFLENFTGVVEITKTDSTSGEVRLGNVAGSKFQNVSSLKISSGGILAFWGGTFNRLLELAGGTINAGGGIGFSGAITVSADSIVNTAEHTISISGAISGTETLKKTGTETLKKTGTGTLTISSAVGEGATITSSEGQITLTGGNKNGNFVADGGTILFGSNNASNEEFDYIGTAASMTAENGGTINLGVTRQTLGGENTVSLKNGGKIIANTATNTGNNGSKWGNLDFNGANTILAEGTGNEIDAFIRLRSGSLTLNVAENSDLKILRKFNPNEATGKANGIIKTGAGTLTLSGNNSGVNYGTTTIEVGTLVAAHANALGTGSVTVKDGAKLGLIADVTLTGASGIELNSGAKLLIDLSQMTSVVSDDSQTTSLNLISEIALSQGGTELTTGALSSDLYELSGLQNGWTASLLYDADTNNLSLSLAIPEPSLFGLLAGLGALTLVGTRRRAKRA